MFALTELVVSGTHRICEVAHVIIQCVVIRYGRSVQNKEDKGIITLECATVNKIIK